MMHGKGVMYYPTNQIVEGEWYRKHSNKMVKIRNDTEPSETIKEI
jgi:hypothetical protein